jgi:putative flippase GtrA
MQYSNRAATFGKQVLRYYCMGIAAFVVDIALFQIGMLLGAVPVAATAVSTVAAGVTHFIGNRTWTFGAKHRSPFAQARTYAVVIGTAWMLAVAVVWYCTAVLHIAPLAAKLISIAVTTPIGFFGHKYLTYGNGIRSALKIGVNRLTLGRLAHFLRSS